MANAITAAMLCCIVLSQCVREAEWRTRDRITDVLDKVNGLEYRCVQKIK